MTLRTTRTTFPAAPSSYLALALGVALAPGLFESQRTFADVRPKMDERKIDAPLLSTLQKAGPSGRVSFLVLLSDQADLSKARSLKDPSAQGWYVYRTLFDHAERTQAGVVAEIGRHGAKARRYFIANMIHTEGNLALAQALARRPDVRILEANPEVRGIEPDDIADRIPDPPMQGGRPHGIEWGVRDIRAESVWDLGFRGQKIVVANADTGVQWDHPALVSHYRGGTMPKHDYSWWDAIHDGRPGNVCGVDAEAPCDDNGHGTHTTATSVGDDGMGNQVGVAPEATWIACRNMERGNGTPARYAECFQFFLAPTNLRGEKPDPDLRPHVINNSWGCPRSEGCGVDTLQLVVENTQAAGIFVEVSAGNSGPNCGSVSDPPALYDASFATGAYSQSGSLANFSSRGPVTQDGSLRLKPDLSAPGVSIRSALPGGRYGSLSGTSMAGPHVVGAVALLWSARPELVRNIEVTKEVLRRTARPYLALPAIQTCVGLTSDFIPNPSYGSGKVDIQAAVTY